MPFNWERVKKERERDEEKNIIELTYSVTG